MPGPWLKKSEVWFEGDSASSKAKKLTGDAKQLTAEEVQELYNAYLKEKASIGSLNGGVIPGFGEALGIPSGTEASTTVATEASTTVVKEALAPDGNETPAPGDKETPAPGGK